MPDYSTAASNAADALDAATSGGMVEEYEIGGRRVKRGKVTDQVKALAMLNGLANRQSGGMLRLAKFQAPE